MKPVLCTFVAVFMFAGILAGCLAILLLVILMVRFPPLLIAVVLACWILSGKLYARSKSSSNPKHGQP